MQGCAGCEFDGWMFLFSLAPNESAARPLAGTAIKAATPSARTRANSRPSERLVVMVMSLVIGVLLSWFSFPTTASFRAAGPRYQMAKGWTSPLRGVVRVTPWCGPALEFALTDEPGLQRALDH